MVSLSISYRDRALRADRRRSNKTVYILYNKLYFRHLRFPRLRVRAEVTCADYFSRDSTNSPIASSAFVICSTEYA